MSMVSKLMANDEFRNILSSVTGTPDASESAREDSASASADGEAKEIKEAKADESTITGKEAQPAAAMPDLSALVNPEMLRMLPGLIGMLGQSGESGKNDDGDEQRAFLCALRPFLSDKRRRAVDMIISMEKLGLIREILPKEH